MISNGAPANSIKTPKAAGSGNVPLQCPAHAPGKCRPIGSQTLPDDACHPAAASKASTAAATTTINHAQEKARPPGLAATTQHNNQASAAK